MTSQNFVPGLELSRHYYEQVVLPLIVKQFPDLKHAAALLGPGSEVIGMDTPLSTDHNWGSRVFIFLTEKEMKKRGKALSHAIVKQRPAKFMNVTTSPCPDDDFRSTVVTTVNAFWEKCLGKKADARLTARDWLTFPQQQLLTLAKGGVFRDEIGELTAARRKFHYYPRDVWLYVLAAQWQKISEDQTFVSRIRGIGDPLGFRLAVEKMVREVMKLCFYLEQEFIPYNKWFGDLFAKLPMAGTLTPILLRALLEKDQKTAEEALINAYLVVGEKTTSLLKLNVKAQVGDFYCRSYRMINADDFVAAIREAIGDRRLKKMPLYGAIDQWTDSSTVICDPTIGKKLAVVY